MKPKNQNMFLLAGVKQFEMYVKRIHTMQFLTCQKITKWLAYFEILPIRYSMYIVFVYEFMNTRE